MGAQTVVVVAALVVVLAELAVGDSNSTTSNASQPTVARDFRVGFAFIVLFFVGSCIALTVALVFCLRPQRGGSAFARRRAEERAELAAEAEQRRKAFIEYEAQAARDAEAAAAAADAAEAAALSSQSSADPEVAADENANAAGRNPRRVAHESSDDDVCHGRGRVAGGGAIGLALLERHESASSMVPGTESGSSSAGSSAGRPSGHERVSRRALAAAALGARPVALPAGPDGPPAGFEMVAYADELTENGHCFAQRTGGDKVWMYARTTPEAAAALLSKDYATLRTMRPLMLLEPSALTIVEPRNLESAGAATEVLLFQFADQVLATFFAACVSDVTPTDESVRQAWIEKREKALGVCSWVPACHVAPGAIRRGLRVSTRWPPVCLEMHLVTAWTRALAATVAQGDGSVPFEEPLALPDTLLAQMGQSF